MADLVIALDHYYVARFGNGAVARAMQILDVVDNIYRDSLGVALNNVAIRVFPTSASFPVGQPDTGDAIAYFKTL